jgi:hypothetical protein
MLKNKLRNLFIAYGGGALTRLVMIGAASSFEVLPASG